MPDVFGMGEILVDKIRTSTGEEKWLAGGSVFNTLMNLHLMGIPVAFHSSLSKDEEGCFLTELLAESGFSVSLFSSSEKTLYAEVQLDSGGNPTFKIFNRELLHLLFEEKHKTIMRNCKVFHTSAFSINYTGSRDAVLKAFEFAQEKEVFVSFDLNMRSLEGDIPPEELRDIAIELMLTADFTKPSRDDLSLLFPDLKLPAIIEILRKRARGNVVITHGGSPIIHIKDGETREIEVNKVPVVDGTGAGDAFNAAVLASVLKGIPFSEAIESGKLLASMVVGHYGALAGPEDLLAVKSRIF
ncbi:carbohydrate kinase family protein [Kosmotoga pacifica]|uniref:Carbohydrate kinase PfkB domain-containing protein n=1 Tax=Kosmotoga pacifica TaxID=1330330 RepID=A0A0G2ZGU3_9BACT|nr:PfkB family carbohydrate kinase [Kosmotoga pacifica]AKI97963.1 hypothetical protein IX53_09170 [Kosmotoga pacifica]